MSVVLSRAASPVVSSAKREELRSQTRRLRRKMLFESLEDRSLLATLYWDPNGSTAGIGGTGTWDLSSASWTTDSTGATGHVAWNNANNDTAVFGGTAGTVTIDPAAVPTINVGGIDFAVTGYTVAAAATKSLTLAANSNVSVAAGSTASISGEISGTNGFNKTNAGELVLGGTNTYAGLTNVNAGKLSVNGSTAIGSPVTVNAGASLGGTGTVSGAVTTVGTGRIDAGLTGATAGTLLIDNALTLGSTSTFSAQLGGTAPGDGAGFYDRVTASNTVDLGGATLSVSLNGFLPAVNDQFTIIDKTSAGPIAGTFNGLAEGQQFVVAGTTFQISYVGGNGNDVVLTTITAAVPATPLYINEIYFNPAGTDSPNEYVELRGTPNAVIQMGYYLVGIEGDSSGPGDVQNIFDLAGLTFGSNGLLVILQKANSYTASAGANVYVNAGTGAGFGSGTTGSSVGHSADSGATDIENSSASFLLVAAPAAPSLTDDIDSDNNGTPDGTVFAGWTVLDSVGVTDSASDFGYGALNFDSSGVAVTNGTTVATSFVAGYFGRIGNSVGSTAADWVASVTSGTAPNFSLANATGTTPTSMANMPLNHIGAANPAAPASFGVTVTPTAGLTTTESGGTATFTIVLNTQPTADVTIPLSSNDTTEGTVTPASVTFTAANWNVPQTVTVTGADDAIVDGTIAYAVVTGAATSTDPTYSGFDASDVSVSNSDNDAAGITVTPTTGLTTTEAGGTATFTIVLNMQPTADVTIPLNSSDSTEGTASPASITFTTVNWNVPQTITVTGVDDALVDGTVSYTVVTGPATSTDLAYNGFNATDVSVSNTDNEVAGPAGVTVTPTTGLTTTEAGGTATFTIVLNTQPTGTVTIPLTSSDLTEGTVSPTSVTFTTANWNVPQTVTVTGVDDVLTDGTIAYSVVTGPATSTDLAYSGFNAADVSVSNTDNEVAGPGTFTVSPTSGLTTTESGGVAVFTFVLNSQPTADVTIPLSSSDTTEGTISPTSLTFTSANWNVPQFVTVTGVDDVIADGTVAYTVITGAATSTDTNYSGVNPADVALNNVDNEVAAPAGVTVAPTSGLITTEAGGTATFTIVLNSQPTGSVTIPLTSNDLTEGTVSPSSVTFTTANWNVPQIITVTGVDDAIVDGTVAYLIVTGSATSTDVAYSGFNANDVGVANTDNDAGPGSFTVSPMSGLTTTESGGIAVFTVVLNTQPTADVIVPLSSSDTTEGTVSPTNLTFTSANWNVPQFVTVTGADDAIADGTIAYTIITGAATSTDTNYGGVNPADVALNNIDNEPAAATGVTVTPTSGLITTESGGTATFTIVLNSQPTGNVTIPLSSSDATEGSVSPSSVTFTTANWNVPQTVTVTGIDDAIVDGTIAYTVVTGAATSTDLAYSGFNANDVGVSNTDNDAGPGSFTVTPTSGLTTTESGGIAVFTVVLNTQPTANVVVPLSSSDVTEGTISQTSLTFTPTNWNMPQFVTVTGADDAIADGTIAYTIITGAATSTDTNYSSVNPADVALNNVDNEAAAATGVTVTPTSGLITTEAGGTATFTIVLNSQPTANVTIPLSSSDATEGSVSPSSVTFTSANWNVPQTVTVTGIDDAIVDGTIAYTVVTGPATSTDVAYSGFNANDVGVSNTDNDAGPGSFTVSPTSGLTTTESGGVAVFTVVLNTQPTANVTIPLTSSDTTEGTVSPTSLTFTSANWNVPQLVTVTGVDDAIVDGTIAYTIITGAATSTDTNYSGVNATDVSLSNVDNEVAAPAGVTVTPTSGLVTTEAGGTATFTIVLTSQPTANVTIPLSSSDATEGSVSPSSVTFTTANWNVPQTVTVTGLDDAIVDGAVAYTVVTGPATSTDLTYSGFNAADVAVSNTDNDASGPGSFTVSPTSGLTTTESGGIAAFTIVLNTQPTSNVTIPLTSSDTTEGTVSPASITFTTANWNVPQLVTVTGVDDAIVDGTIAYSVITGAATSTDTNYSGVNAADVSLSNADNEVAVPSGITVTPTAGLTTSEAGGTATFTIVLNSQPTGSVTIPVTSGDLTEGTVSPASITFTTANWNVPQTVTVTGVDDALVDGNVAYTVITGAATSTDTNYSGSNAADVAVTNTDNETGGNASPTISDIGNQTANEDTSLNNVPFTVNDAETAAGSFTVSATSSDTTLFPAGSITFGGSGSNRTISLNPAANQSGTATITVTVDDGNGGQTSDTFTVTVNSVNDAPTLNPISNPPPVPQNSGVQTINLSGITAGGGETQNLTVTATSSNPALIPNPTVTYTSPNSTGTLNYTPVPNQSGTSTITVTVTDNGGTANGGVNTTTQTFTVSVSGATIPIPTTPGTAQIIDDPENPGQRVLVINGTSGLDVISLWRSGSNRTLVLVPLSGINRTYDNSTFDRILINGFAGSDRIFFDPFLDKPATIYGGSGDDIILAGAGNDVIYGGTGGDFIYGRGGNDFIFGEAGRDYLYGEEGDNVVVGGDDDDVIWGGSGDDVLNGGAGFDYIYGFGGSDLIIGGNLGQSNNLEGMRSIQTKWSSNQSFNARITSLAAEVNPTTVTDDNRADWIFGMDGSDWLVDYASRDQFWDDNSNDRVN